MSDPQYGKGSRSRITDKRQFDENYDRIFRSGNTHVNETNGSTPISHKRGKIKGVRLDNRPLDNENDGRIG